MSNARYAPLLAILEREWILQKTLGDALARATDAARGREIEKLRASLEEFEELTRREQAFSAERTHLLNIILPRDGRTRSLREIAALPGAPSAELLQFREKLAAAAEVVRERFRRLSPLVRELGEVYNFAVNAMVHRARGGEPAAEGAPREMYTGGSLINREA